MKWKVQHLPSKICCRKCNNSVPWNCIYSSWVNTWSNLPALVGVVSGSLLGEFICRRRCPYTAVSEERLDTLRWLSPPPSITAFPLSPYLQLFSSLSLSCQHGPPLSCCHCLRPHPSLPPSLYLRVCAPVSQGREQVTAVKTGGPPGSAMQVTDGAPRPFLKTVDTGVSHKNAWCLSISPFCCGWQLS